MLTGDTTQLKVHVGARWLARPSITGIAHQADDSASLHHLVNLDPGFLQMAIHRESLELTVTNYHAVPAARRQGNNDRHLPVCGSENRIPVTSSDVEARMETAKRPRAAICPNRICIVRNDSRSIAAPCRGERHETGDDANELDESASPRYR
jgi:hypothetical protein